MNVMVADSLMETMPRHPLGCKARVLLTSVFGPYAQDDAFGGKGKSIQFYRTGDDLFDIMCQLEKNVQVQAFFVMDENFLVQ